MNLLNKVTISSVVLLASVLSFAEQVKKNYSINADRAGQTISIEDACGRGATAEVKHMSNGNAAIVVSKISDCSMYWIAGTAGGKLDGQQGNFEGEFLLPSNQHSDVHVKIYLESQSAFKAYKNGERAGHVAVLSVSRSKAAQATSRQSIYLGSKLELPNCDGTIEFKSSDNQGHVQYNLVVKNNTKCNELSIQSDDGSKTIKTYKLNVGTSSFTIPQSQILEGFKLDLGMFGKLQLGESNLVRFLLKGDNTKADIINAKFVDYGRLAEKDSSNTLLSFLPKVDEE